MEWPACMIMRHILSVLLVAWMAALGTVAAPNKKAMECCVASPSNATGYWSWRLIDERKCWYAGKTVISKSLLRWAAAAPAQAKADAMPISVATEKRSGPMNAQARMLDDDSFESRWRARVTSE